MGAGQQRENKHQGKHRKESDLIETMPASMRLRTLMPRVSASALTIVDCRRANTSFKCGLHPAISLFVTVANDDDGGIMVRRIPASMQARQVYDLERRHLSCCFSYQSQYRGVDDHCSAG